MLRYDSYLLVNKNSMTRLIVYLDYVIRSSVLLFLIVLYESPHMILQLYTSMTF